MAPRATASHNASVSGRALRTHTNRIRVAVGEMPRMLREIIEGAVVRQADMMLVAGDSHPSAIARRADVDVAIVTHESRHGDATLRRALVDNPKLKMLVVSEHGRTAHVLEFHSRAVADLSPEALVRAIRTAITGEPGWPDVK